MSITEQIRVVFMTLVCAFGGFLLAAYKLPSEVLERQPVNEMTTLYTAVGAFAGLIVGILVVLASRNNNVK